MARYASAVDDDDDFDRSRRPPQSSGMRAPVAFLCGMVAAGLLLVSYQSATYKPPPACPTAEAMCPNIKSVLGEVLKGCPTPECPQAKCPTPRCPEPRCPTASCPKLELPDSVTKGCPAPDASRIVAEQRAKMLQHVGANIIECAPGKDCRGDRRQRFKRLGQQGVTLWFTGLSGAGKTTITEALERELVFKHGKAVYRIDGDNLRTGLTKDLGFSPSDRTESVRRASETAALFADAGVITMVTLISPYREARNQARSLHRDKGLPFLETYLDVPLDVLRRRDPKGLYKKVDAGLLKGFTGIDAPYEPPLDPEIVLKTHEMSVDACVAAVIRQLEQRGLLGGEPLENPALAPPDGGIVVDLIARGPALAVLREEAKGLPGVPLRDVDVNWLQVIGEGWASPLRGFMREGALMQSLHFNSLVVDPHNFTGMEGYLTRPTDWLHTAVMPPERVSMPIPIVLPISDFTRRQIGSAGAVTLYSSAGRPLAVLRAPEVYAHRKEEIIARCFGAIDPEHPYIKLIESSGEWLLGGEVTLLGKVTYGDGLDRFRLTVNELRAEFARRKADTVFAFQTRNPTHAGHAFLMRDAQRQLKARGYKNPVLWLSPLGGWTKDSDMPLDVRLQQHDAVINEGMLDAESTVMAIWPAPMIYAGPTEVQFHAKSRRIGGASFFVVGRDPAGMPRSSAGPLKGEDLYHSDHGRYVLSYSPGVGSMEFLSFQQVYYDKRDHTMKPKDKSRADDFISISGTKMRKLAAMGATACPSEIPADLLAAKCIPPGFMVDGGWAKMVDYYQNVDKKEWVPYSTQHEPPALAPHAKPSGRFNALSFAVAFDKSTPGLAPEAASASLVSPWHHVSLQPSPPAGAYQMVVEIPRGTTSKLEVQKALPGNPIKHDSKKGKVREYTYGLPFFNYGLLPQTWEDPAHRSGNFTGDNDPLDIIELGAAQRRVGEVVPVRVLGNLKLIDQGELDHKILALALDDPRAASVHSLADIEQQMPGVLPALLDWLKMYKTTDGKAVNLLESDTPDSAEQAKAVITECHEAWKRLAVAKSAPNPGGFWLP